MILLILFKLIILKYFFFCFKIFKLFYFYEFFSLKNKNLNKTFLIKKLNFKYNNFLKIKLLYYNKIFNFNNNKFYILIK